MANPDEERTSDWVDSEELLRRAEVIQRESGKMAALLRHGQSWWDRLDKANGFGGRWDNITGRAS